jgi:hypothetical protein
VADASEGGDLRGASAAKAIAAKDIAAIHARDKFRLCIVELNFNGSAYRENGKGFSL